MRKISEAIVNTHAKCSLQGNPCTTSYNMVRHSIFFPRIHQTSLKLQTIPRGHGPPPPPPRCHCSVLCSLGPLLLKPPHLNPAYAPVPFSVSHKCVYVCTCKFAHTFVPTCMYTGWFCSSGDSCSEGTHSDCSETVGGQSQCHPPEQGDDYILRASHIHCLSISKAPTVQEMPYHVQLEIIALREIY